MVLDAEDNVDLASETDEQSETRRMKEYEELMQSGKVTEMSDVTEADLLSYAQNVEDIAFGKFKKRIATNNDQVLRYNRGGEPLWISSKNTLSVEQVPPCEQCQSKRVFEFQVNFVFNLMIIPMLIYGLIIDQIMPQMLNHLKDMALDWGVISVYTCEQSCSSSDYVREFVYKQDIIQESQ